MNRAIVFFFGFCFSFISLSAQSVQDSLIRALRDAQSDTVRISLNISLSDALKDEDLGKSLQYALTAVEIAQKKRDYAQRTRALAQAGTVCFYGGLLNRAVDYFSRALNNADKSGDLRLLGNAYFNLGGVHTILGDFKRSRTLTVLGHQTLERFYKDQHAVVPSNYLFSYFNNLGLISMKEEKPGQAKAYFLKAIGLARSGTDPVNVSRPMISLAELLISTGRLDSARQLLTEVVVHGQAHGLKSVLSIAHTFLGDLSLKQSDPDQALEHFRTALELAKERNDVLVQERVSKNIASIFQLKQKADSALFYLQLHNRLTEISEKSKARQSLLQQDLESRLQEQEISAIRQLRIERTILGVVGGATIGFMFFLLIRYRRRATVERIEAQLREEKLSQEKQNLQESLDLKDKQLAAQVMHSLQKNEMISELVTRIKETTVHQPDSPKGTLGKMIREIESSSTEPWKEFEQRFQEVHAGFYERLMAKHPDLTANERRLCAFLRLDMSTKEISNITGQSVKAITQARFRLRAKLGIENPDISLFEVLLQI